MIGGGGHLFIKAVERAVDYFQGFCYSSCYIKVFASGQERVFLMAFDGFFKDISLDQDDFNKRKQDSCEKVCDQHSQVVVLSQGHPLTKEAVKAPHDDKESLCKHKEDENFQSDFLKILKARGFLHQITDPKGLDALLKGKKGVRGYVGFDVTAPSLHVGNLITLMIARWFQETGHEPILLVGGGTTKIGDPSGRDLSRQLLSDEKIQENIDSITPIFQRIFSPLPKIVNNSHWLDRLEYIPFLRTIGSQFSVNRMLSFDSVRLRLERQQPLSFIEFNYMLLQSYDFLKLYETQECMVQFGGSDQWGNIVCGVDLVRRMHQQEVFGLTCPLLTTACGAKMGKTAEGAVWLKEELLSPYDYWQFWRSVDDRDVIAFLKLYTMLSLEKIAFLEEAQGQELNDAKILLADEATALIHGKDVLKQIHQAQRLVFGRGDGPDHHQIESLDKAVLDQLPVCVLESTTNPLVSDCLVALGFVTSKSEARRAIRQKSVRLDQKTIEDECALVDQALFCKKDSLMLSLGRKKHGILLKKESTKE
jgi:tyrosyl-tRNA synthetase